MTEEEQSYPLARLVLDFLRAFAWPVILLVVLVVYREDLMSLVSEREFEAFGVRVGPRVEEVQENVEAELADIRELLDRQKTAPPEEREQIAQDLDAKVQKLEENVGREVQQIRRLDEPAAVSAQAVQTPREQASIRSSRNEAQELERQGFEALLDRDVEGALAVLDRAHRVWPDYHNVAEIRRLLRTAADDLRDPGSPAWNDVYRRILTDYSWGMSKEHREALREQIYSTGP